MGTADDLRDLRDALDCIAHGALPRWGTPTTKLGGEAQTAAREVYEKFVRALHHESAAKFAIAKAEVQTSDFRAHCEALTARCEAAERERDEASVLAAKVADAWRAKAEKVENERNARAREVDKLRDERRMFRRRIAECLPWVGCTPYPNTSHFNEMIACRDLAKDTLDEVPE